MERSEVVKQNEEGTQEEMERSERVRQNDEGKTKEHRKRWKEGRRDKCRE